MTEMGVDDHAESLEFLEVAVYRRNVDVRRLALDLSGKILRRSVSARVEKSLEETPPGRRDSTSVRPQPSEDLLNASRGDG